MNFRKYLAFIAVLVLCLFVSQGEAGLGKKLRHGLKKLEHTVSETGHVITDAGKIAAGVAAVGAAIGG